MTDTGQKNIDAEAKEKAPQERRNGLMIDEANRVIMVQMFYEAEEGIAKALGGLEVAKDLIKQKFAEWGMRDAQRKGGIIVPGNGKGRFNVH